MCECFNTKIEEIHSHLQDENPQPVDIRFAWKEESLNYNDSSRLGLSLKASYMLQTDSNLPYDTIEDKNFFIPLKYCPFCGEKIEAFDEEENKSLQELFDDLEEELENKLDNITVNSLDDVLKVVKEEMKNLNVDFPLTISEEELKIEIRFEDNSNEDDTIEIFLESDDFDDEETDGYTVSIF